MGVIQSMYDSFYIVCFKISTPHVNLVSLLPILIQLNESYQIWVIFAIRLCLYAPGVINVVMCQANDSSRLLDWWCLCQDDLTHNAFYGFTFNHLRTAHGSVVNVRGVYSLFVSSATSMLTPAELMRSHQAFDICRSDTTVVTSPSPHNSARL